MLKHIFQGFVAKTLLTLIVILVIVGVLVGLFISNIQTMIAAGELQGPPRASVATADVSEMQWPVEATAIGSISALKGVILSVESPGIITDLNFKSGQPAQQGTQLMQLDDGSEQAELKSVCTAADLAWLSVNRSRQLLERKTISQAEFDVAQHSLAEFPIVRQKARRSSSSRSLLRH